MRQLPITFLAFSTLLCVVSGCASRQPSGISAAYRQTVWSDALRTDTATNRYRVAIRANGQTVTGLCVLKRVAGAWRGSVVNEFGAKAFDFTITSGKGELHNTIAMLDRWYIRRTIAGDLHFMFAVDDAAAPFARQTDGRMAGDTLVVTWKGKRRLERGPDGTLTLRNLSRGIEYRLNRLVASDLGNE